MGDAGFGVPAGRVLFDRRTLQNRNFRALRQLIKVICVATGLDVQVGLVTGGGSAHKRHIFLFLRKFLKTVEDLLINQVSLFHPTFEASARSNARKSLFAIQNFNPVAVSGESNLVEHLRKLIAKYDLRRSYVIHFEHTSVASIAGSER